MTDRPPEMARGPASPLGKTNSTIDGAHLSTLAEQINTEHEALARDFLKHARRVGELLIKAKAAVPHGTWNTWLAENCRFSARTSQRYMQVASGWQLIEAKPATVADLTLRGAAKMLAKPKRIDWEVKVGESADVAPPLDPGGYFFTITKDDTLVVVQQSDENAGYYVVSRCGVIRDADGDVCSLGEDDVFRPLKPHAVGFWLEQFGCSRSDTWLRLPRPQQEVRAAA